MLTIKTILNLPIRVILTAHCFIQFAVQVLWLSKWQMPRILRSGEDSNEQRRHALYAAHNHVGVYLKTLSFLDLVEFRTEGTPIVEPSIVIANHPSLLDFIVFLRDFPNAICLYKSQSLKNPVLSAFVQVAGYIEGMDGTSVGSKRIVASCCERLEEGHHVIFFPEGTRSGSAVSMRKFRKTAFHAAVKSGVAIQPVAIYCDPLFLGKDQRWFDFCRANNRMVVRYLPPIRIEELAEEQQSASGLSEVVRAQIEQALQMMDDEKLREIEPMPARAKES